MICENAHGLVPAYLDGELSDEQASPLRDHLLGCPACRETAKQETALKRWFSEADCEHVEVPAGFAARVARRAFAGDVGIGIDPLVARAEPAEPARGTLLPFMLKLTALAAGLLFILAIALQRESLPGNARLGAESVAPWDEEDAVDTIPFDSLPRRQLQQGAVPADETVADPQLDESEER